jgi:hypothetical protein
MSIIENWDFHSNNLSNIDLNLMSFSETIPPHAKVFICIDEGVNVSQHTHLPCLMDRFQILQQISSCYLLFTSRAIRHSILTLLARQQI